MSAALDAIAVSEITAYFAERAAAVDQGDGDVRESLRWLGRGGLVGIGAPGDADGGFGVFTEIAATVAAQCLSSAFSLWSQHMAIEYIERATAEFADAVLPALRAGALAGSSAMAPAFKDLAGIEPVPVAARRTAGGYILHGPIRWASNLFPGAVVILPARTSDGGRLVAAIRVGDPGLHVAPYPRLLALNATASSSARLEEVRVPDAAVLADDLPSFVRGVRPFFLLSQTAFCAGLAGESLRNAAESLTGTYATLADDVRDTARRQARVRERLTAYSRSPMATPHADLLRLRLDAAIAAERATRLELATRGGAGYAMTSPACRRLREAAFLPIQAPTEGQLRWEIRAEATSPAAERLV